MPATTRVLSLLHLLQDRDWVPGPELAARLEIDQRMLRRDVVRLQDLGIPVESRLGRHGGYRLRPGYRLPPLMLTDDEATAVALSLRIAQQAGLGLSLPATTSALAKIRRVLPPRLQQGLDALEGGLVFAGAPTRSEPAPAEILLRIAQAIAAERRVRMSYGRTEAEARPREVDAYGLVGLHGRWYLAAFDHGHREVRTFRADRIRAVSQLPMAAPIPPSFDAAAHVARSLARVPWGWEIDLVTPAEPSVVRASLPATVAEVDEIQGGAAIRFRAADLDGAARMLAAMPWPFRVRRPRELIGAIRLHAERLLSIAAGTDEL